MAADTPHDKQDEAPAEPANPGLPAELWNTMLPEHKAFVETIGRAIASNAEAIANVSERRAGAISIEDAIPADFPAREHIAREYRKEHAKLDRLREDAKALHGAAVSSFDKAMWSIVWEHTQKQREADRQEAIAQREADRKAQDRHNAWTYWFSLAALIVSAITAIVTAVYR